MVDKSSVDIHEGRVECLSSVDLFGTLSAEVMAELADAAQWIELNDREALFLEGDPANAIYVLASGNLQAFSKSELGQETFLATMDPGDLIGEISLVFGDCRTATVRSLNYSKLLKVSKAAFDRLVSQVPGTLDKLAALSRDRLRWNQLLTILPKIVGTINADVQRNLEKAVEWVDLKREGVLFQQGDSSNHVYIIVSGRLCAFIENESGKRKILSEMAQSEIVGEMGLFTEEPRAATVCALRHSTVAKIGRKDFESLIKHHPEAMMSMMRQLISRLRNASTVRSPQATLNITLIPAMSGMGISDFAQRFTKALKKYGTTLHINDDRFNDLVGLSSAAERLSSCEDPYYICLHAWLEEQENIHKYVIFEAGNDDSNWTTHCLQHADIVISVADVSKKIDPDEIAKGNVQQNSRSMSARKILVLLHQDDRQRPEDTASWLALSGAETHSHVRQSNQADFERLARIASGRAVGLVLGGGGARAFAHIGAIRAFEEAGIPIDMIGGTSMGAVISAQYAMGWNYEEMLRRNREAWIDMKPHRDLTLPIIALTRGKKTRQVGDLLYGDTRIEDLWTNFFCMSSSLSTVKSVVHKSGLLSKAVIASASIPGIAVPVIDDGDILIDGGLLNNLPADVMKDNCGGDVFAVNVGSEICLQSDEEEFPSPWKVLSSNLLPMQEQVKTLKIFDILLSATFLGGVNRVEQLKEYVDYYLRPPVDSYSLLSMESLDEIAEIGYEYTREQLQKWVKEGRLDLNYQPCDEP